MDSDKTKYISVGFYPSQNYQPQVEIGSSKSYPLILTDRHVKHWRKIYQHSATHCVMTNTLEYCMVTS